MNLIQYPVDGRIQRVDKNEKLSLVFKVCDLDDAGTYSVEITEFVKNGERDQTDCWLDVEGEIWETDMSQMFLADSLTLSKPYFLIGTNK